MNSVCYSMCKVLENRAQQDEERMDQLTNQLKEARLLAEDADGKSDEVIMIFAIIDCKITKQKKSLTRETFLRFIIYVAKKF